MRACYGRNIGRCGFAVVGTSVGVVLLLLEHRSVWFCCCRNIGRCGFAIVGTSVDVVLLL